MPPPTLVGLNFDVNNIQAQSKQKMVDCEVCDLHLNAKSLAKHMRGQYNLSGPGKPRAKSQADDGWIKNKTEACPGGEKLKRKAEGHISPADKVDKKKEKVGSKSPPKPSL